MNAEINMINEHWKIKKSITKDIDTKNVQRFLMRNLIFPDSQALELYLM